MMEISHYELSQKKDHISAVPATFLHYEESMSDDQKKEYRLAMIEKRQFKINHSWNAYGEWPERPGNIFLKEEVKFFSADHCDFGDMLDCENCTCGDKIGRAAYEPYLENKNGFQ